MKQLNLAVLALFTVFSLYTVNAQDENNPWAVGVGVNIVDFYNSSDFSDNVKDHLGNSDWNFLPSLSRITGEKYLDKGFSLQFAGSLNRIDTRTTKNDVDFLYWSLGLNVKYDMNRIFGDTGWWDPFIGVGGNYVSTDGSGEGMISPQMGFNVWFNDNLGINFTTAANFAFANEVRDHIQSSLGLVVKFGGKDTDGDGIYDKNDACPDTPGLAEFNGCPDSDGDGIKDSDDACPNVAGLASMNGCPDTDGDGVADKDDMCPNVKGTKANNGCPDTDGDGVIDKDDKCPSVAGPAANNGCPWPDTDGDGVLDKDDKCPNEVGPASNMGCPEDDDDIMLEVSDNNKVFFDFDKATLRSDSKDALDDIFEVMEKYPNATFEISGHTDSIGTERYNLDLSKRRAESVRDYFIKKGISADRLVSKYFGENKPLSTNATADGRQDNRRVVITVPLD